MDRNIIFFLLSELVLFKILKKDFKRHDQKCPKFALMGKWNYDKRNDFLLMFSTNQIISGKPYVQSNDQNRKVPNNMIYAVLDFS